MLTWVIVILVFAILGVSSYYKGAIRSLISLVGLGVALMVSMPLAPYLAPLMPKIGLEHPIWKVVVPPAIVFLLLVIIFTGIGFFVHHKVSLHYKYATDDYTRLRWERLNQRLGLCVGFVAAAIYCVILGVIVYSFGYPAVQVTGPDSPAPQRMLAKVRQELRDLGLDKSLAALDPMSDTYYLASDIFGLLYHNSLLQPRLYNYPAFLALSEQAEFKEIATDSELQNLLQTGGPAVEILRHPKIVGIINNESIVSQLKEVDLRDLYGYLRTGHSDKYAEEKILGRWEINPSATLVAAKRRNPDMPVAQMRQLKTLITVFLPKVTLMATPDNQAVMNLEVTDAARKMIEEAQARIRAAAEAAQAAAEGGGVGAPRMDPAIAQRYGLRAPTPSSPPPGSDGTATPPARTLAMEGIPDVQVAGIGTWSREGIRYKIRIRSEGGRESVYDGVMKDDQLILTGTGQTLIFERQIVL
ncbi:MAG: CvpA family protein [Verrucomicrobia bacterium]|nr:CvpA family protein [Verrucomicrobiota bacterium]